MDKVKEVTLLMILRGVYLRGVLDNATNKDCDLVWEKKAIEEIEKAYSNPT